MTNPNIYLYHLIFPLISNDYNKKQNGFSIFLIEIKLFKQNQSHGRDLSQPGHTIVGLSGRVNRF